MYFCFCDCIYTKYNLNSLCLVCWGCVYACTFSVESFNLVGLSFVLLSAAKRRGSCGHQLSKADCIHLFPTPCPSVRLEAWSWPWWKYLYHGNRQMLQSRAPLAHADLLTFTGVNSNSPLSSSDEPYFTIQSQISLFPSFTCPYFLGYLLFPLTCRICLGVEEQERQKQKPVI